MIKDIIRRSILEDLIARRMWGGKHTAIKNLYKGLPSNVTSDSKGKKLVDKVIKEMINDFWLLVKKSTGEIHVSLNPKNKKEIMGFVLKH